MAIPKPPPDYGLWPAVKPRVGGWIESDEDAILALGDQWTNGANAFDAVLDGGGPAGAPTVGGVGQLGGGWTDDPGRIWQSQILKVGNGVRARETDLRALAVHTRAFADDVIHAKQEITRVIVHNLDAYGTLVTMPGGADVAAQETFVAEIVRAINAFLDALAAQIAARAPGVAAADRPTASVDKDDLDGFGLEEFSDIAGTVSAMASAGALLFPPAAAVLYGHGVEYAEDPTLANGVTVAADALGALPGVGVLSKGGGLALEEAATSVNPLWREIAGSVNGGDGLAKGMQATSRLVPQVPTATDLVAPGEHSDIAEAGNAQKVIWRGLEQVARLR